MHLAQWIGLEYREKYVRRYRKCDILFGIEPRLRKEGMEEQFNREAKEGWRFAADAARMTDENAGTEDCKHTSGESFLRLKATWEQWRDQKKVRLLRSQVMKEELASQR